MKQITKVSILKRKSTNGRTYLSLGYFPHLTDPLTHKKVRSESLHVYIYSDPVTPAQVSHNTRILELVEVQKARRIIELTQNEFNIYNPDRLKEDFLAYLTKKIKGKNPTWRNARDRFSVYMKGHCTFADLTIETCEGFRDYLLNKAIVDSPWHAGYSSKRHISQNTAAKHFIEFRNVLHQAYVDGYLPDDINSRLKNIPYVQNRREYLTKEEILRLYETPCKYDVLKSASMFCIFSGLRLDDIVKLEWKDIVIGPDGYPCIRKVIEKTKKECTIFISDDALTFCGPRSRGLVFKNFRRSMTVTPLRGWLHDAGITKHITFHCFRHTYASLLLAQGVDLYTISQQLAHADIKTTQIYLHMYAPNARKAANTITLDSLKKKKKK